MCISYSNMYKCIHTHEYACVRACILVSEETSVGLIASCLHVLQCVAICCSALQCVAAWVCCSGWQCDSVWCSVLQWGAVCCSGWQCVAVCCSMLQWVAVCITCKLPLPTFWNGLDTPTNSRWHLFSSRARLARDHNSWRLSKGGKKYFTRVGVLSM